MAVTSYLVPMLDEAAAAQFDAFGAESPFAAYQQSRDPAATSPQARLC